MRGPSRRKLWAGVTAAVILAACAAAARPLYRVALVGSGYSAEMLCSALFVSHREESDAAKDLTGPGYELLSLFWNTVDVEKKRVTSSIPGFTSQTAIFRDGLGCTLLDGKGEEELRAEAAGLFPSPASSENDALWPEGERVDLGVP
jgi:hypothetical protein